MQAPSQVTKVATDIIPSLFMTLVLLNINTQVHNTQVMNSIWKCPFHNSMLDNFMVGQQVQWTADFNFFTKLMQPIFVWSTVSLQLKKQITWLEWLWKIQFPMSLIKKRVENFWVWKIQNPMISTEPTEKLWEIIFYKVLKVTKCRRYLPFCD